MYIYEIDDILDQTLDKFMYSIILDKKSKLFDLKKFEKECNFIKNEIILINLIEFGQALIDKEKLSKFLSKTSNILLVKNIITKYICYYLFILIGINFKGKIQIFNNNLIEFSRNLINHNLKIENFFSTESDSNIIKIINLILDLKNYFNKLLTSKNKDSIEINNYLKDFLKLYGEENIQKLLEIFKNKSISEDVFNHNIIKVMIYLLLYKNEEKKEIFNIIENSETNTGEYIFIDVVVPRSSFIDYNSIESILSPQEIKTDLPEEIYKIVNDDYSNDLRENKDFYYDYDKKIKKLLNNSILIPIIDYFLLYHKDNEKY